MQTFSPKQIAQAIGVSEASLKRWCDRGFISSQKTAGGHRRISKHEFIVFLRENKYDLVAPEILGLPHISKEKAGDGLTLDQVLEMLQSGDESSLNTAVTNYFLAGNSLEQLFDNLLAPALHKIGQLWSRGELEIYQERLACEICHRLLIHILNLLKPAQPNGPLALGASLSNDPYALANIMVEVLLRDMGWHSRTLGNNLPIQTLIRAVETYKPRLMWLSISSVEDNEAFTRNCKQLWETCTKYKTMLVVGGRALNEERRAAIRYTTFCDNLRHLVDFLNGVQS